MATIHPSRLGLVPQAPPPRRRSPTPPPLSREEELRRKLLEKRKGRDGSFEAGASRSASADAGRNGHTESPSLESGGLKIKGSSKPVREESPLPDIYRSSPPRRERDFPPREAGRSSRRDSPSRRDRGDKGLGTEPRPRSRSRDRYRERRPSPTYASRQDEGRRERDYGYSDRRGDLRPPPGPPSQWPPFPPQHGYAPTPPGGGPPFPPGRNGYDGPPPPPMRMGFDRSGGGGYGGPGGYAGGKPDFERRRQEREENPLSIWPPSPKRPYREEEDMAESRSKRKSKKSKSKRRRRYSDESESTDTEEERERRRRRKRDKERRRRHDADEVSGSEAGDEQRRQRTRYSAEDRDRRSKSRRTATRTRSLSPERKDWIEKDREGVATQSAMAGQAIDTDSEDDADAVGPQLPAEHKDRAKRQQFKDMLPGEAAAMAAFAASGQRIPRRGEIGLDAMKIEEFEASGFVMSGNRHKRMNAVRLRKENQVISAEEKRAILNLQKEERMKKEGAIISQFKELLDDNWRSQGLKEGQNE